MSAWDLKHLFPEAEVEMWNDSVVCYVGFSCFLFCEEIQNSVHHNAIQDYMLHARKYSGDVSTCSVSVKNNKQEKQLSVESTTSLGSSWELDLLFWLERIQVHIPQHLEWQMLAQHYLCSNNLLNDNLDRLRKEYEGIQSRMRWNRTSVADLEKELQPYTLLNQDKGYGDSRSAHPLHLRKEEEMQ